MKMRTMKMMLMVCFLTTSSVLHAQQYSRAEQTVIQPFQVMIENYSMLQLPKQLTQDLPVNYFDKMNAYTYIQIIRDSWGKDYHILFQTSFSGKILFLGCSNNVMEIINKTDKPQNVFINCLKYVNDHLSAVQNIDAAVKCVVDRLIYCSN